MAADDQAQPPWASSVIRSMSLGVQAPSSAAIPSQVADRTNLFASFMLLMVLGSNGLFIIFYPLLMDS
jgi:hypothetical protein